MPVCETQSWHRASGDRRSPPPLCATPFPPTIAHTFAQQFNPTAMLSASTSVEIVAPGDCLPGNAPCGTAGPPAVTLTLIDHGQLQLRTSQDQPMRPGNYFIPTEPCICIPSLPCIHIHLCVRLPCQRSIVYVYVLLCLPCCENRSHTSASGHTMTSYISSVQQMHVVHCARE